MSNSSGFVEKAMFQTELTSLVRKDKNKIVMDMSKLDNVIKGILSQVRRGRDGILRFF